MLMRWSSRSPAKLVPRSLTASFGRTKFTVGFCGLTNTTVIQNYKERILSPTKNSKQGYLAVHIGFNKMKYTVSVHKLVLLAFVGKPPKNHEACHNNGIAWDNRIENLRFVCSNCDSQLPTYKSRNKSYKENAEVGSSNDLENRGDT